MNTYVEYGEKKTEVYKAIIVQRWILYLMVLAGGVFGLYHMFPNATLCFTIALILLGWKLLTPMTTYAENRNMIAAICAIACIPMAAYFLHQYKDSVLCARNYKDYHSDVYRYEMINNSYVIGPDGQRADGWSITLESDGEQIEEFTEYEAKKGDIVSYKVCIEAPFDITDPLYESEYRTETARRTDLWVHDQLGPEVKLQGFLAVTNSDGEEYDIDIDCRLTEVHHFWDVFLADVSTESQDDYQVYKYVGHSVENMVTTLGDQENAGLNDAYYLSELNKGLVIDGNDKFNGYDAYYMYSASEPPVIDEVIVLMSWTDEESAKRCFDNVCLGAAKAFAAPLMEEDDIWMTNTDEAYVYIKREYNEEYSHYYVTVHMLAPME